jgi:hypothetical protein
VPKRRVKDIIYFNPTDLEHPIPFNPLESAHRDDHYLIASGVSGIV